MKRSHDTVNSLVFHSFAISEEIGQGEHESLNISIYW